jgi:LysR family transcriptional activator of nhaA
MAHPLNYRHLHYFWVAGHEGSLSRAADRLGMAVQTVSEQVRELERSLGVSLLKPAGRGLALTEAGTAVMRQADQIFELGEKLPEIARGAVERKTVRLAAGISDGLPKLVVRRLLEPVVAEADLRLICQEGPLERLLGELALHRLDVVLADRPAPANPSLRLYSRELGMSGIAWYAPTRLSAAAKRGFPASLERVPVLLPSSQHVVRGLLDRWFEKHSIQPKIAGEFDDSALLKTFGASGLGVFPAVERVEDELVARYAVTRIGSCDGVEERFFAIGTERKITHPLVRKVVLGAE